MRNASVLLIAVSGLLAAATCVPQNAVQAPTLDELGRLYDVSTYHAAVTFPSNDDAGYGSSLAWGTSYVMLTLNLLYEVTGDTAYLEKQLDLAEQAFRKRDIDLAAATGNQERYTDHQRNRVLKAWGTGTYSDGKYTCWAVHAGMVCFPVAEMVRLVRAGGEKTAAYSQRAEALVPLIEQALTEFDSEWCDGPEPGQGYYVFPNGSILPLNQQNAPGRALLVLSELTGKQEYRDKADKLLRLVGLGDKAARLGNQLSGGERLDEMALMLGAVSDANRIAAQETLEMARQRVVQLAQHQPSKPERPF